MAKKRIKKNSPESVSDSKKIEEPPKPAPVIPAGLVTIAMSKEDMAAWANLMSACAQTFEELAMTAAQNNDEAQYNMLKARHQLSYMFAEKLINTCRMPEPISRDFH